MNSKVNKSILFPNYLFRFSVNEDLDSLSTHLYDIRSKHPGNKISNVGGWQSETLIDDPKFNFLFNIIEIFTQQIFKTKVKKLGNLWGNINPINSYNEIHSHTPYSKDDYEWSGIFYIKYKEGNGIIHFHNPEYLNQSIPYIPVENELVIFPSHMPHQVMINTLKSDRISLAFNFTTIDKAVNKLEDA